MQVKCCLGVRKCCGKVLLFGPKGMRKGVGCRCASKLSGDVVLGVRKGCGNIVFVVRKGYEQVYGGRGANTVSGRWFLCV